MGPCLPLVDSADYYDTIPSEIRTVHRRACAGRDVEWRIAVLVTEVTRDEAFAHAEAAGERRMRGVTRGVARRGRAKGAAVATEGSGEPIRPEWTVLINGAIMTSDFFP